MKKRKVEYIIPVTNEEQFNKVKKEIDRDCKIFFNCCDCHKPTVLLLRNIKSWPGKCKICKTEDTNIKNHGVKYNTQREDFKEKRIKSQNGVWVTKKALEKMVHTKRDKNNGKYLSEEQLNKRKETFEKHKLEDPDFLKKIKEKIEKTSFENTGAYWGKTEEYWEKIKEHNLKKFGSEYYFTSNEGKKKCEESLIKNWGVRSPLQNPEIRRKAKSKYLYKNIKFDSSWEIAFYIWLKDHNVRFEYHPLDLIYFYNGKSYHYEVDFKLWNSTLVEIKGEHLLKPMIKNENAKSHAKYMCMIQNHVNIITNCDKYLDYINKTYGTTYLRQFKIKKKDKKNMIGSTIAQNVRS